MIHNINGKSTVPSSLPGSITYRGGHLDTTLIRQMLVLIIPTLPQIVHSTASALKKTSQLVFNKCIHSFKARIFLNLELGTTKPIFYHDSLKPLTPPPGP
jgi:hypothetical protein